MKQTIFMFMLILIMATTMSASGHRDDGGPSAAAPHLLLDSAYIDIGTVICDSVGEGVMHFRNSGDAPLLITRIFSDCGCTVPVYPDEEVLPGAEGEIRVRFNSRHRHPGPFRKALRIRSNADNSREVLIVKGNVIPPRQGD